jgi:acylphosphatase
VTIQPPASAPTANRHRLKIFYSGRVQGVGFRYTAKTVATGFEIAGCVRNLPDGRVELIAEGARTELEGFRDAIRGAGLAGFIQSEQISWDEAKNEFRSFEISR